MKEYIDVIKGIADQLVGLPTILLVWPAMNVLGWLLKKSEFPNKWIPLVVVPLPAVIMCFILPFDMGKLSPFFPRTEHCFRCGFIGLLIGFLSWGTHRAVLARVEKFLPGFDTNDTKTIEKPKDPP